MRYAFAIVILATVMLGCKAPEKECKEVCTQFATLSFWERANAEIAAAPPAERDALRAKKNEELKTKLAGGDFEFCVGQCRSANDRDGNKCAIKAQDLAAAKKCLRMK